MLLKPDIKLDRITEISLPLLKSRGINSLILDVDNTMSTHHGTVFVDGLTDWLKDMQSGGIKLCILSNSVHKRIAPFAARLSLPFISTGLKPLPTGFIRALKLMGSKRKNTAVVGDQIFTDTLGANISGLKIILLTPIKLETSARFRFKRWLEKGVYKIHKIKKTQV